MEYAKKLPQNTRDKLLRKIVKKNLYIKTDLQAGTAHLILHIILDQITGTTTPTTMICATDKDTIGITIEIGDTNTTQDMNKEVTTTRTGMIIIKIEIGLTTEGTNQPKVQIIFEYTNQNIMEMMHTVRGFINFIKANPANRDQFKSNKLATCKEYNNEVNESEIHSSNLDEVQQLINEDKDIVFDALVAADYIDEIECTDGHGHQQD